MKLCQFLLYIVGLKDLRGHQGAPEDTIVELVGTLEIDSLVIVTSVEPMDTGLGTANSCPTYVVFVVTQDIVMRIVPYTKRNNQHHVDCVGT